MSHALPHYWKDFVPGAWQEHINVRDFIQKNYTPYTGDESFLVPATKKTQALNKKVQTLLAEEQLHGGVLDMDTATVSTITSHAPGYIDKALECIVGLQTEKPLKRALQPNGGIRMARKACAENGYTLDSSIEKIYTQYRKTHNDGVFDVYTPQMRKCRSNHIITGLPDAYGRGRIIGDYRRVALYGVDRLITAKEEEKAQLSGVMDENTIRSREELTEQIRALRDLKTMAASYGFDISEGASNVQEAIQWTYFAYLGAIKEQNGAAMSLGRVSTFFDIYAQRDLAHGIYDEAHIQELVDHFVMKLRLVKFARTPEYNALFSGDPTWVTESVGGMGEDGRPLVTKMSYRILHTLTTLGPSPEPNLTVLWSERLPQTFKRFCANTSIATSAIQYENDELMRPLHSDDYAIACCVSSMRIGYEMQFFGARANLAKCLLYAINSGKDEMTGEQVGPKLAPLTGNYLDYDEVWSRFCTMMRWLANVYVNMLNIIHYMHDKYSYERLQMALHHKDITRWFATGIAGLSVVADSLSAIKYARVKALRNKEGIADNFEINGSFPAYGNDDDRVDLLAKQVVDTFMEYIRENPTYRNSIPTTSILTITSNVVYGKNTGATPDGRAKGEPFAPGANPMHRRDTHGALASLNSVAKLDFANAADGISNTFSILPSALGAQTPSFEEVLSAVSCNAQESSHSYNLQDAAQSNYAAEQSAVQRGIATAEQIDNLVDLVDGYTQKGGHHLNVNVFSEETLRDAQQHPKKYPQLTVRVSGYAVSFHKLTKEQQDEVISRTLHSSF